MRWLIQAKRRRCAGIKAASVATSAFRAAIARDLTATSYRQAPTSRSSGTAGTAIEKAQGAPVDYKVRLDEVAAEPHPCLSPREHIGRSSPCSPGAPAEKPRSADLVVDVPTAGEVRDAGKALRLGALAGTQLQRDLALAADFPEGQ